jgi:hypothetical protein
MSQPAPCQPEVLPPNVPADDPGLATDYDAATNGTCANGHPVNRAGRCAVLNGDPLT